jgi:hypothetical protein
MYELDLDTRACVEAHLLELLSECMHTFRLGMELGTP